MIELRSGDTLKFGDSTTDYVFEMMPAIVQKQIDKVCEVLNQDRIFI
jgi:hypothetical protein